MIPLSDQPESAVMQVPLPSGRGAKRSIQCALVGVQGARLLVEAGEAVPAYTALSIEHEDRLILGEVVSCAPFGAAAYRVEIKVEQILTGLQNLMALRSRLLGEAIPQQLGLIPAGVRN